MARTLARIRGTQPWIRIVTTDKSVDDATAARWTVEQATGQFVALVAPGYTPDAGAITRLLARLHNDSGIDAAVLIGTEEGGPTFAGPVGRLPPGVAAEIRIFGGPPRALATHRAGARQVFGRGGRTHRVHRGTEE